MIKVTVSVIAIALSATIAGAQPSPPPAKTTIPLAAKSTDNAVAVGSQGAASAQSTASAQTTASPQGSATTHVKVVSAHGHGVVQRMASPATLLAKPGTQTK